ncbi:MAG TPA: hypothetical protein VNY27_03860 [Solirubrobacteraceae bacterium]|nr:hypothetical protein [Solirubrobacteraceae bacterium]
MSKLVKSHQPKPDSKLKRTVKAVPWAALLQGTLIVGRRWAALSEKERARFAELVRRSRGRVRNLSMKERLELRKLAHKLDVRGMGRDLAPLVLRRRHRRGRRRRR